MVHEAQLHDRVSAVTLTYRDEDLPPGDTLRHRDFQNFLKRIRKAGERFRYFMCGEYGETKKRPHYHAILFGVDWPDRYLWMHTGKSEQYRSDRLESFWPHGFSTTADADTHALRYTAGYLNKKLKADESSINTHTGELLQPYQRMSTRPAIAKRWIERYVDEVYDTDSVVIDGYEMRPPAFYDRYLRETDPDRWRAIREQRILANEARPQLTAKRYRQMCEAQNLKQQPFEERPLE
jgi:hypothetical protein